MRKRHRSLALAIVLPTFLAIILGEALIYLGGYFSVHQSDYQSAIVNDQADLATLDEEFSQNDYALLGYGVGPVIKAYEDNKPSGPLQPGSAEEAKYKETISKAAATQLYASTETRLERYVTTFIGIFYEDVAENRMVLVCTSDQNVDTRTSNISLYLGAFFDKNPAFGNDTFYGVTVNDPVVGQLMASGLYLGEVTHPVNKEIGPYPVWMVRETLNSEVYANIPDFTIRFLTIATAVLVGLATVLYLLIYFVVIRPAKRLSGLGNEFSGYLLKGEQKDVFAIHKSTYSNELTDLNDALYYSQEAIRDYSDQLRISTANEERLNADLALAERIQSSMVPDKPLVGKNYSVRGYMTPAKEVGGDLYNFFQVDDDHIAFFIGDVSGKGVGAGLFMVKANIVLRLAAENFDFDKANRMLCEGNTENLFVTAFMAILEISTGKLRYVNAGHEPVFIYRNGKYEALEEEPNFMLGYLDDLSYVIQETTLAPGDRLFLYTDGVSEAMNQEGELFGKARILDCLNSSLGLPSAEVFPLIRSAVDEFVGKAEQSDDACILGVDFGERASLSINADKEDLKKVAPFIDDFLADIDEPTRATIQIIADEMCSNAVYYSQSEKPIRFILRKDEKFVEGFIVDEGIPFNPLTKGPKEDDDKPGGLGILMTESLADEARYDRVQNRNVFRFKKNRGK